MTSPTAVVSHLLALGEGDLPALIPPRSLRRGIALAQEGAVSGAKAIGSTATGRVRDRTPRSYTANVTVNADLKVIATCTCGQTQPCEHAAAVLVAWTANRTQFDFRAPTGVAALPAFTPAALIRGLRSGMSTLVALLAQQRVTDLRRLAGRFGLDASKIEKDDLAVQLAGLLATPTAMAEALQGLSQPQRLALSLLQLSDAPIAPETLATTARLVGEALPDAPGTLRSLSQLGLAFTASPSSPNGPGWQTALELTALPPVPLPRPPAPAPTPAVRGDGGLLALLRGLDLVLAQHPAAAPRSATPAVEEQMPGMVGWNNLPEEIADLQRRRVNPYYSRESLTVAPPPPPVTDAEAERLARLLKRDPAEVRFLLRLLARLGQLGRTATGVILAPDASLRSRSPIEQLRALVATWAADTLWSEVHELPDVVLRRRAMATFAIRPEHVYNALAAARRFVVRLVRAFEPGAWHSVAALSHVAQITLPAGVLGHLESDTASLWFLAYRGKPVDLLAAADWEAVGTPFVASVIRELHWLGLLEADASITTVRLSPLGLHLLGLTPDYLPAPGPLALTVNPGLHLRLDTAATSLSLLAGLSRAASPDGIADAQLGYRITPASIQAALSGGTPIADIAGLIQSHSTRPIPPDALKTLNAWASSFGQTQIYTGLCLLELDDELLLPELLRATSLAAALLDQLTPRVLLIDPARAEPLWAELVAKGYTPRRVRRP